MSAEVSAPRLIRKPDGFELRVDGEPYLLLGAQVHNSSAWPERLERVWPQLAQLHANTLEVPIYWQDLEPEQGRFCFERVEAIVESARCHGARLVLLWFGTWKNGTMDYAPTWIKNDPARFPRMVDPQGAPVRVLSPHAASNLEADQRAFGALMAHVREIDRDRYTVIMVQVENEPGSLFTVRDFSPAAERLFEGPVPELLAERLGLGEAGNWRELFGPDADEAFAACHVATFVNAVARSGKAEHPLPLSVNAWLRERKSWELPGEHYPSGGPTSNVLDLWKALTPDVDVIAPDIYVLDAEGYREVCRRYGRADNPLLIPETFGGPSSARYLFHAVGNADAIGFAPFGFDRRGSELDEAYADLAMSYRLLRDMAPPLLELRGPRSGGARRVQAAIEEDEITQRLLRFEGWDVLVQWGEIRRGYGGEFPAGTSGRTGRALVAQRSENELFVAGFDSRVSFRPARERKEREAELLLVEEGRFDGDEWRARRLLNGDQIFFGLQLRPHGTLLRVLLRAA